MPSEPVRTPSLSRPDDGNSSLTASEQRTVLAMNDEAILALVTRLARPHSSGGKVIERAAILAEGADFRAVLAWITSHEGLPEVAPASPASRGLHGGRLSRGSEAPSRPPRRFVLPAGSLT